MFDFVRTHSRLMLGLLVLLVIPSFVFFGIQGYDRFEDGAREVVASVDGIDITRAEWDDAHRQQIDRVRAQYPEVDAGLLDTPAMRYRTLEALVRNRVLQAAVFRDHLVVGDQRLARIFRTDPQYASLRQPDGSVNPQMLAAQGMSSAGFAARLKDDLAMRQVTQPVSSSTLMPQSEVDAGLNALLQRREAQWQRFDAAKYLPDMKPSSVDIEAYYNSHQDDFRAPEEATINYVVLDLPALAEQSKASDDDLKQYYEQNIARYTKAEERRARHILIKADDTMSPADQEKAKAKAEALLKQVRAKPASFAELAKQNSDDPASAAQGGDLDFFGRDVMAAPFDKAVFSMKKGEISDLVKTEYGYHIIQVTDIHPGSKKSFDEVKPEIAKEVGTQLAQSKYAEAAEKFNNISYEQPDSLKPVADELGLKIQTATVTRQPQAQSGPLASAKLLEAVFADDALNAKHNTPAIETGPNQLVSAHVVEHRDARVRSLDEVREQVTTQVRAEQAASAARRDGEALLARLRNGDDVALPSKGAVSRTDPQGLAKPVIDAVMAADDRQLPALMGVDEGRSGYTVARVVKVEPRDAKAPVEAQAKEYLQRATADAETLAFYDALKARFEARIDVPRPEGDDALARMLLQ